MYSACIHDHRGSASQRTGLFPGVLPTDAASRSLIVSVVVSVSVSCGCRCVYRWLFRFVCRLRFQCLCRGLFRIASTLSRPMVTSSPSLLPPSALSSASMNEDETRALPLFAHIPSPFRTLRATACTMQIEGSSISTGWWADCKPFGVRAVSTCARLFRAHRARVRASLLRLMSMMGGRGQARAS